ncbi:MULTISPECIES: DNA-binding protein [Saccharibacillus]|uniref:DNA-binding protein n=1 Tax=Saccharibacillus TaxID=456492 RepID=UPI00123B0CBB|nr:DNA-binding protein [Saccharibacillus sp. WB 17]MWJ32032.1 DNA-binding protein [Saccharibacillus sp. WB 17]
MEMTLRSEIEKGIAGMGMNFSEFGEWSGINRGIFSAILNSNPPKPISLNQLERIGRALGREDGWMFEAYINECFYDGRPNRRRVEPFLLRCAALGRNECIEEVLSRLLEDLRQLDTIFDIAEALYASGSTKESVVFYRCIVQNEKYHQSERLAISHYRLFRAALGEDNEQNLRAAIEFEPFCEKLPDHHRLDGLMKLVNVYLSMDKRAETKKYSQALFDFSQAIYRNEEQRTKRGLSESDLSCEYPLIVYYGYGFLAMQNVMLHEENYEQAKVYINAYANLDSCMQKDQSSQKESEKFKFFAKINLMQVRLLEGDPTVLPDCVRFIEEHPSELWVTLLIIVESANRHQYDIDDILDKFAEPLHKYPEDHAAYSKTSNFNRYIHVCYESAVYLFKRKKYGECLTYLLLGLEMAIKINNKDMFMKYVPLFEGLRDIASHQEKKKYENLMKRV